MSEARTIRIASWNINGLRARLPFITHWLEARSPDVVGLQELKLTDEQFPHAEFEALGYQAVTHGQKAWNGVAILSRQPARVIQRGLPGQEDFGARLLTAEVEGLAFTTVYCPNGKNTDHDDFPRKLKWFDSLKTYFEQCANSDQPVVLCGDFNICPAPIDSWNEAEFRDQIFHTQEERTRFQALLGCGFVDPFRELHPTEAVFSWWDYRGGAFHRKRGLRIDFMLTSPAANANVQAVEIDREYRKKKEGMTPSDHAPVLLDLITPSAGAD
jgi:exodeoxyribonuclease-3